MADRLDGNALAIIKPTGVVAVAIFSVSVVITALFHGLWAAAQLKKPDSDQHLDESEDEEAPEETKADDVSPNFLDASEDEDEEPFSQVDES